MLKDTKLCLHLKSLDSISSKLKPLVSGTEVTTNRRDNKAITPNRRKRFSAPSNSYKVETMTSLTHVTVELTFAGEQILTFRGEKAKVTIALEPKLVRTARLIPFPLVRSGKISDTISQLIGPKDIFIDMEQTYFN